MNQFDKNKENNFSDKYHSLSLLHSKVQLICKLKNAQLNQKHLHREIKALNSLDKIYEELSSFFLDSDFSGEENLILPVDTEFAELINRLDAYSNSSSFTVNPCDDTSMMMEVDEEDNIIKSKSKKAIYLSFDYVVNHVFDVEYMLMIEMKKLQLQQMALKEKDLKLSEQNKLTPFTSNTKANTSMKKGCNLLDTTGLSLNITNLLSNKEEANSPLRINNSMVSKDYFNLKEDDYIRSLTNLSLNRFEFNISSSLFNK